MPEHTSLEELYREAVLFPGPASPLRGLRIALETVEEELAHAIDQATIRLRSRHQREAEYLHPEDRELDEYELAVTVEQLLPRVFRGGFILTLWSVFEIVVKRMAEYVRSVRHQTSVANEFKKKRSFLCSIEKVYTEQLSIQAFPDAQVCEELDALRYIRNALVHHNGSVMGLPESLRAGSADRYALLGLKTYTDIHDEFFVPTASFLAKNFLLVEGYLSALSHRVYTAVHPMPAEDADA